MSVLRKPKLSEVSNRHDLYQRSVQDTEAEIDFIEETWNRLRERPASFLREDFCGTANTACEWVRRGDAHYAIGVDLDRSVLDWGERNNIAELSPDEQRRIELVHGDVLQVAPRPADIILAMNFSYFLFHTREAMREYFKCVCRGLSPDGLFFLDAYGGYDAPRELEEERDCGDFTYIWEQATFNPIDSCMTCHIHFAFPDGSRMDQAFTYHWRLWTLPELREILLEAGFSRADIYWEGTDHESKEGTGIFSPSEVGDADAGWVCYIVAQP